MAIATPPGRGGIGIVRLSGGQSRSIAEGICRLRSPLAPGRARFAEVLDEAGRRLDEAVVTYFAAPHSYTTEDVVEIAAHGSPVLLEWLVRAAIRGGARLAEPGEFTQRAFLAGRIDLTQAEAVNDLIAARTLEQARVAAAQLGGSLSRSVAPLKIRLVHLIAELEAGVDFAEDDLDLMAEEKIVAAISSIGAELTALAASYRYGQLMRDGFKLAIVGRPNAGKSSLFNRLLQRDRAIVTAEAGTTRDAISEVVSLGGIPVELIDTAGLRDAPLGEAETLGIARSRTTMAEADFVLLVVDATLRLDAEDSAILASLAGRPHAVAWNKSDLVALRAGSGSYVSAKSGDGIEDLKAAILAELAGGSATADAAVLTNLRQHQAILEAAGAMSAAEAALDRHVPHEMLLLDLHEALEGLDKLTGATTTDHILGIIFSSFCIGK